jgi:hypothetical protein
MFLFELEVHQLARSIDECRYIGTHNPLENSADRSLEHADLGNISVL